MTKFATQLPKSPLIDEEEFQLDLLQGVSRTFALTIPQLPKKLRHVVSNAYLLCRAIDTIEDEPALNFEEKKRFSEWFVDVVERKSDSAQFSAALSPLLSENTIPKEHELIKKLDYVIDITNNLDESSYRAVSRCIRIMAEGMTFFQQIHIQQKVEKLTDLDKYCYHVAGVVGEMLTDLFSNYIGPGLNGSHIKMKELAVSFGQSLQMTNIIKDLWVDLERGVCWLPNEIFDSYGYKLDQLRKNGTNKQFQQGLMHLIGINHTHIQRAFQYILHIPASESGIRNFCLWALFMSLLTLQQIRKNITSNNSLDWKIDRKQVKGVVMMSHLTAKHDWMLKTYFNYTRKGLPEFPTTFKA